MKRTAIIFDLDETLIPDHSSVEAAFAEAAQLAADKHRQLDPAGLAKALFHYARELWYASPVHPWARAIGVASWEALSGDFSGPDEGLTAARQWLTESRFRPAVWEKALATVGIDDAPLAEQLAERLPAIRADHHKLFGETRDVLDALKDARRLALLTNGPPQMQRNKIESIGLDEYFDAIFISGELGFGKPDSRAFQAVLDHLEIAPAQAVMVGDSLERDIAGAQAAGMAAVWINRYSRENDGEITPDAEINDLTQLLDLGVLEDP